MACIKQRHKGDCAGWSCECPWRLDYRPHGLAGPHKRINFPTKEAASQHLAQTLSRRTLRHLASVELGPEKEIEKLTAVPAAFVLSGSELLRMRRPCVYFWIRGEELLYVGKGSSGIERPLGRGHHRLRDMKSTDFLLVYQCSEGTEVAIEQTLIATLKPRFNGLQNRYRRTVP
jgi:hypothetical protein